jgi:uncharacterized protein with beta-barrel porin domain
MSRGIVAAILLTSALQAHGQLDQALRDLAANPTQAAVGDTIAVICPDQRITSDDFQARCTEIVLEAIAEVPQDVAGAQDGLQAMGAEEDTVLGTLQIDVDQGQVETIQSRLSKIRGGIRVANLDLTVDGHSLASSGAPRRGTAAGEGSGGWSIFANFGYATGDRKNTVLESGFDFDTYSITGGADYMVGSDTVLGLAGGYSNNSADLDNNGGDVDSDGYTIMGYASYFPSQNAHIDGIISYSDTSFDQNRAVRYILGTTNVNQIAISSTDSQDLVFQVSGGYDWFKERLTYGVYGRFEWARTDIDGFQERMSNSTANGNGLAIVIDDQDFTSVPLTFGARIGHEFQVGGQSWLPEVYAEYTHEFDNDNKPVIGYFVNDPSKTRFVLPTDSTDRDYMTVGVQASTAFSNSGSAYLLYETLLFHEYLNVHSFEAGLRFQF